MEPGPTGQEPFGQAQPQAQPQAPPQQPTQIIYRGSRAGFWIALIFGILLLLSAGLNMFFTLVLVGGAEKSGEFKPATDTDYSNAGARDKIAVIRIEGTINDEDVQTPFGGVTLGQLSMFKGQLAMAEADPAVKAIILDVNSPGGYVTASDEMHHLLTEFKGRHSSIPVIAYFRDLAASGAYYVSVAADKIVAMPTCTTGSIGVIAMLPNVSKGLDKIGVEVITIKSGEMKDAGSPFKKLNENGQMSDKDMKYFQDQINSMYAKFLQVVYDGRKAKTGWTGPDDDNLKKLADGRAYMADEALNDGLIDGIGYFEDAVDAAKKAAGITEAAVIRYHYVPPPSFLGLRAQSTMNVNTGVNVQLDMAKLTDINSPKFMYYWKP